MGPDPPRHTEREQATRHGAKATAALPPAKEHRRPQATRPGAAWDRPLSRPRGASPAPTSILGFWHQSREGDSLLVWVCGGLPQQRWVADTATMHVCSNG